MLNTRDSTFIVSVPVVGLSGINIFHMCSALSLQYPGVILKKLSLNYHECECFCESS